MAVFSSISDGVCDERTARAELVELQFVVVSHVQTSLGLGGRGQGEGLGVQALGGQRAFQRLGDAGGGAGRIEGGGAVAPVEHEGGARRGRDRPWR